MLRNLTRKTVLAERVRVLRNPLLQAIGLMFSKKRQGVALFFDFRQIRRISVHNFFVFYPIDLIFLGQDKRVRELKQNFRPFAVYFPKYDCRYLIEVIAGKVKESRTGIGDTLDYQ